MSASGPGCVKTRLGEGCAELFSQLPSSERSCQYNRLPHRRNRDGSSPRKLGIRVFTQPGPKAVLSHPLPFCILAVRSPWEGRPAVFFVSRDGTHKGADV